MPPAWPACWRSANTGAALGDEKLLRRYERARKADVAAMGAVTDGLQQLFAQTDEPLADAAQLGHERL